MAKDAELDRLKTAQDLAYQRKQDAYQAQQRAWEKKRSSARDAMNRAFEAKQRAYAALDSTLRDLQRMRYSYGPIIERLNSLQETAFQNMKRAFDNASSAYDRRDGAGAASYAAEGHRYEAESQGYVNVRRGLVAELRSAKERHDATKPAFQRAKDDFNSAKRAFDSANAAKAGVPHQYHDNVWISTDSSGNTNIYFGGVGKPNGPGHGHYVMDRNGNVTYKRDPFDPHGAQNFEKADLYMRSARRNHEPLGTNEHGGVFYRRSDSGGTVLHVTQYFADNYHVSWDATPYGNNNVHWTNKNVPNGHPDRFVAPPDALFT